MELTEKEIIEKLLRGEPLTTLDGTTYKSINGKYQEPVSGKPLLRFRAYKEHNEYRKREERLVLVERLDQAKTFIQDMAHFHRSLGPNAQFVRMHPYGYQTAEANVHVMACTSMNHLQRYIDGRSWDSVSIKFEPLDAELLDYLLTRTKALYDRNGSKITRVHDGFYIGSL